MDALPKVAHAPEKEKNTASVTRVEIKDGSQSLVVEHDGALSGWNIDEESLWEEGEARTDGLVIGDLDGEVVVCFVELTGNLQDKPYKPNETMAQHKLRQLDSVVDHFHPSGRGTSDANHGAVHHDAFASGADPVSPLPSPHHRVIAIVAANRLQTRLPTPPRPLGVNSTVVRQFRVLPKRGNGVARVSFRDLVDPP